MSRHDRRREAKLSGLGWRAAQLAKYEADIRLMGRLREPSLESRRALAEWAARPGRTQAEVDAMNARVGDAAAR